MSGKAFLLLILVLAIMLAIVTIVLASGTYTS